MKFMLKKKIQRGSSLIEVLVATTIVSISLVAVIGLIMYSVERSAQVRYQEKAADLSQNLMEIFFKERVMLGWNSFYQKMFDAQQNGYAHFCADDNNNLIVCSAPVNVTTADHLSFKRWAQVETGVDSLTIKTITSWQIGQLNQDGEAGQRQSVLTSQLRKTD